MQKGMDESAELVNWAQRSAQAFSSSGHQTASLQQGLGEFGV